MQHQHQHVELKTVQHFAAVLRGREGGDYDLSRLLRRTRWGAGGGNNSLAQGCSVRDIVAAMQDPLQRGCCFRNVSGLLKGAGVIRTSRWSWVPLCYSLCAMDSGVWLKPAIDIQDGTTPSPSKCRYHTSISCSFYLLSRTRSVNHQASPPIILSPYSASHLFLCAVKLSIACYEPLNCLVLECRCVCLRLLTAPDFPGNCLLS